MSRGENRPCRRSQIGTDHFLSQTRHLTENLSRVLDTKSMSKSFVPPEQYYAQLARVRQGAGALITTVDGRVVSGGLKVHVATDDWPRRWEDRKCDKLV